MTPDGSVSDTAWAAVVVAVEVSGAHATGHRVLLLLLRAGGMVLAVVAAIGQFWQDRSRLSSEGGLA